MFLTSFYKKCIRNLFSLDIFFQETMCKKICIAVIPPLQIGATI
jgi:hypothetical protein